MSEIELFPPIKAGGDGRLVCLNTSSIEHERPYLENKWSRQTSKWIMTCDKSSIFSKSEETGGLMIQWLWGNQKFLRRHKPSLYRLESALFILIRLYPRPNVSNRRMKKQQMIPMSSSHSPICLDWASLTMRLFPPGQPGLLAVNGKKPAAISIWTVIIQPETR